MDETRLQLSFNGEQMIKDFEGYSRTYYNLYGVCHEFWGHEVDQQTGASCQQLGITPGTPCPGGRRKAQYLFEQDVANTITYFVRPALGHTSLTQYEFDAIVFVEYNEPDALYTAMRILKANRNYADMGRAMLGSFESSNGKANIINARRRQPAYRLWARGEYSFP